MSEETPKELQDLIAELNRTMDHIIRATRDPFVRCKHIYRLDTMLVECLQEAGEAERRGDKEAALLALKKEIGVCSVQQFVDEKAVDLWLGVGIGGRKGRGGKYHDDAGFKEVWRHISSYVKHPGVNYVWKELSRRYPQNNRFEYGDDDFRYEVWFEGGKLWQVIEGDQVKDHKQAKPQSIALKTFRNKVTEWKKEET